MKLYTNKRTVIIIAVSILLGLLLCVYILNQQSGAPIINYLPYIFGSVFLLGGLYGFLFSFKIYKPQYKTDDQQIKVDDLLKKRGKSLKMGSIIMILYGAYSLIWHDPNMYRLNSSIENNEWTNKDKTALIEMCMRGLGATAKKYPQISLDYCTCSVDKIMKSFSREEYINDASKSPDEQYKIDSPFIQGCLIDFSRRIDSAKKQGK